MKKNTSAVSKLIRSETGEYSGFPLTLEERNYSKASDFSKNLLNSFVSSLETEFNRVLNDAEVAIDMTICQGTGLVGWLSEPQRLLMECSLLNPEEINGFMAIDYSGVFDLANISLGGSSGAGANKTDSEPRELSASEVRVCRRLVQIQIKTIQKVLGKGECVLPAERGVPDSLIQPFRHLIFKVRLLCGEDAISWFLGVPVELFLVQQSAEKCDEGKGAIFENQWVSFPVSCSVEMARRKVKAKQLMDFVNGAILDIELPSEMFLQLNNEPLLKGKVVEDDFGLMFQVENVVSKELVDD